MSCFKGLSLGRFAIAVGVLLTLAGFAHAETISWKVDADGSWQVSSNWDLGRVPAAGDDVVIDRSMGDYTITHSSGTTEIRSLTCKESLVVSGGTLTLSNDSSIDGTLALAATLSHEAKLVVSGMLTWTGGALRGSGTTLASGGLEVDGTGYKNLLDGHTLENRATAVWTANATSRISAKGGSVFRNLPGATLTARSDEEADQNSFFHDGSGATFENLGTFRKEGSGVLGIAVTLLHEGAVEVLGGSLRIRAGGSGTSGFTAAADTVLEIGHAYMPLEFTFGPIDSDGDVHLGPGGNVTINGAYRVAGETRLRGGLTTIDGGTTGTLTIVGGRLACDGELAVAGPMTWTGGGLAGSGRTLAQGGLEIDGTGYKNLQDGHTLENHATAIWTTNDTSRLFARGGSVFRNLSGATLIARSEVEADQNSFSHDGSGATFENLGTLRKEGSGTLGFDVTFLHQGDVEVLGGTLLIIGGGSGSSGFQAVVDTVLKIGHPYMAHEFTFGPIDSDGDVHLGPGGNVTINGTYRVAGETRLRGGLTTIDGGTTGTLTIVGGRLACDGELAVAGLMTWTGGGLDGSGRTIVGGGIVASGPSRKLLWGGHTLESLLDVDWTSAGSSACELSFKEDSVFRTTATITVSNAGPEPQLFGGGGAGTFENEGTFLKEGAGKIRFYIPFNNHGSVDLREGQITFFPSGAGDGNFVAAADTLLEWVGGNHTREFTGGPIDSDGDVHLTGYRQSFSGASRVAGELLVGGLTFVETGTTGTLTLWGQLTHAGDFTVTGPFVWQGGRLAGAGRTLAEGTIRIEGGATRYFDGRTLVNSVNAVWSGQCSVILANGAIIDNLAGATFVCQADTGQGFSSSSTGTFNNHGTLRKTGSGPTYFTTNLNHQGDVQVEKGALRINLAGSGPGTFTASAGTVLEISGADGYHSHDYSSGPGIVSAGDVQFKSSIVLVGEAYQVAGETLVDGHVTAVTLPGGSRTGSLRMKHGLIRTDGDLTVSGLFTWDLGSLSGTGRTVAEGGIEIGSIFEVRLLEGHTLKNVGTATMSGPALLRCEGDASFVNLEGAVFVSRCDSGETQTFVGSRFVNFGTFRKEGSGSATINLGFENRGDVLVIEGTFDRRGDYTQTAGSTILAGGTLAATGAVDIQGGILAGDGTVDASVANAGTVRPGGLDAAGTLSVTGSYSGAGAIDIEIGDGAFDRLEIGGAATLADSTLNLALLDGFVPATDSTFLVMPYASHAGEFATVNGTQISAVKEFLLDYDADGGLTLTVDGDETPPVITSITADPVEIWPPDHKLKKEITVSVEVSDDSGEPVTLSAEVSSSEGTNEHEPDWECVSIDSAAGEIVVRVRAERDGNAPGRIYTITVTATDSSGNQATAAVTVLVPHDER